MWHKSDEPPVIMYLQCRDLFRLHNPAILHKQNGHVSRLWTNCIVRQAQWPKREFSKCTPMRIFARKTSLGKIVKFIYLYSCVKCTVSEWPICQIHRLWELFLTYRTFMSPPSCFLVWHILGDYAWDSV
jgi:hypothetical protein